MNDIQKSIDNLTRNVVKSVKTGSLFSEDEIRKGFQLELKSLLEQVAKEQIKHDSMKAHEFAQGLDAGTVDLQDYVKPVTDNLTFNED